MDTSTHVSPAVWYARIIGIVLALVGILGLLATTQQDQTAMLLGLFEVNLFHNLFHLVTGIIALAIGFGALRYAAPFAGIFGAIYVLLGVWGLVAAQPFNPANLFVNINPADHWLHIVVGVLGVAAWVVSSREIEERVS